MGGNAFGSATFSGEGGRIAASLAPSKQVPLFEKTSNCPVMPHLWCMGFLSAMRLRFDDWRPLLDLTGSIMG